MRSLPQPRPVVIIQLPVPVMPVAQQYRLKPLTCWTRMHLIRRGQEDDPVSTSRRRQRPKHEADCQHSYVIGRVICLTGPNSNADKIHAVAPETI